MAISYTRFKTIFGDLGITEWVKYNWLSNAGTARAISNEVIEAGYNPLAYVNDNLYNHITKTINIWDEEWELGVYNITTGEKQANTTRIRSKNLIRVEPNTTYYFKAPNNRELLQYDEDGNFISYDGVDGSNITFTTLSNCYYIAFSMYSAYGTTYNNDICINLSNPYINGNYFPYFEGEKFLVLVGDVDLGTLTWTRIEYSGKYLFFANNTSQKIATAQYNCSKYTYDSSYGISNLPDKYITPNGGAGTSIWVRDDSYTDSTTFKVAMSGVILDYQLATPVLVDL